MMQLKRIISKVIWITIFIPLIAALMALANPVTNYELSIYEGTPSIAWALLITSIIVGVVFIVYQTLNGYKRKDLISLGFTLLLLAIGVIYLLPSLRGYYLYGRDDPPQHLGMIKTITSEGRISPGNFYPLSHVLIAILSMISALPSLTFARGFPIFLTLLYVANIFLLSKTIFRSKEAVLLATVASTIPLFTFPGSFYVEFSPAGHMALSMMPLIFSLHLKKKASIGVSVILVTLLIAYPMLHPTYSIALLQYIALLGLVKLYRLLASHKLARKAMLLSGSPVISILILFVVNFIWSSNFREFSINIRSFIYWLYGHSFLTAMNQVEYAIEKFKFTSFEFLELFIRIFGARILLTFLTIIAILMSLRSLKSEKDPSKVDEAEKLLSLAPGFLLNLLMFFLTFFLKSPLTSLVLDPYRYLFFAMVPTPLFVGFVLFEVFKFKKPSAQTNKLALAIMMVSLLSFASVNAIFSVYRSPYIRWPNKHLTYAEVSGVQYFVNHKDEGIDTWVIQTRVFKLEQMITGAEFYTPLTPQHMIPDHFSYQHHDRLGLLFSSDKYLVITEFDKVVYETVWKEVEKFTPHDFVKMYYDPTLNRVYSNSQLEIWRVIGIKEG